MNIREISDVFKDTANQITAIKSYNFGWASDRTRSTNTEDYQELNEFPRVFFSVPTIIGSDQTRKQDTYQVTLFFDDLLGYNNEGDADLTLQLDKWAALQEYANYFVQRLNKVKQTILPNYLFIPEAPSITFDSFTGLQRMITVQLSFTLVVPTNCEPVVSKLVECIANIVTSSNLTASLTTVIKLVSTLQASASLSASALVSKLAASSLTGAGTLAADLTVTSAFDADAQAFFNRVTTAGGTLSATEQNAVNTLVVALKADGIWDKMKAIYPMVGASAAACAQNLKSSSFTGAFTSGWTFSSLGVKGNGANANFNTNLNTNTSLNINSAHISYYSNDNFAIENPLMSNNSLNCFIQNAGGTILYGSLATSSFISFNNTIEKAFFLMNRPSSSSQKLIRNNSILVSGTQSSSSYANDNIYLNRYQSTYCDARCALASIGDGLTDTDAANFYTDVQAFQTTLSRQV